MSGFSMNRRAFLGASMAALGTGVMNTPQRACASEKTPSPNVLFIAVDDLRTQLGCYGNEYMHSPNIDRLAGRGVVFERAYCQQAVCMASRASLMSGYRPDKGQIYNLGPLYEHVPDALPLNQHFLNNGYEAITIGKVYHHHSDEKKGWSREAFHPKGKWAGQGYLTPENMDPFRQRTGPAFECADVEDNAYADGVSAEKAIEELNRLKDKPFFLAVGFHKPHLPFNAPKKYWDLYPEETIKLAANPFIPKGVPGEALIDWVELRPYYGMPQKGAMPDDLARKLRHGYYACVSYTDALVGGLLDELDRLNLSKNTIVVLWGDNGWKLGEHGMWCKHTNFELDTHVPLLISAPDMKAKGRRTRNLAEFVDIYPTLCDLAGLEKPRHLEGTSLAPLLDNPDLPSKEAAYSQYPRGRIMGYSVRTDRYRYTEWRLIGEKNIKGKELYDHEKDPDENVNVADEPENRPVVKKHSELLKKGFQTIVKE